MTSTLERRGDVAPAERTRAEGAAHSRRGGWARRRIELLLAARQARRAWPTSLLVIALIALPMTLIAGTGTFMASRTSTTAQRIASELGGAQAWLMIVGGADPSRVQAPDDPFWHDVDRDEDGTPVNPELPPPRDPAALLPGVELLQVARISVTAKTPGGSGILDGIAGDAADPILDGRYELLDGRRPTSEEETAVSPGTLSRLDAKIGDTLTLAEPSATLKIVGIMKEATQRDADQTVFLPGSIVADDAIDPLQTLWFAPGWQPTGQELETLNRAGVVVYAKDAVAASSSADYVDASTAWAIATVCLIAGGFSAYLVILLAGAGFAVSARRQQRSLAVAASVGADRGALLRVVLLQGTVLGLIGGALGGGLGIALAYPALRIADDGAVSSFWGFHVPWWGIIGVIAFATAVGTASALAPARAATKGDVLSSLRGSHKPARVRADRPFWGTLIGAAGIGLTIAGGVGLAALNAAEPVDYANPFRTLCVIGIVAGPILFQIGAIVAGHWILTRIARAATHLGLAPRIAARDAAANPARIVPAFAAIAACVFIASFGLTATGVYNALSARNWYYQAPVGSIVVGLWAEDAEGSPVFDIAMAALEQTEPDAIGIVSLDVDMHLGGDEQGDPLQDMVYPELRGYTDCDDLVTGPCSTREMARFGGFTPAVVEPADLDAVLGVSIDAAVRAAFADGGAIVTTPYDTASGGGSYLDDGTVILNRWDREQLNAYWVTSQPHDEPSPLETSRVPAISVRVAHQLPWPVILSPAAAADIGYRTAPSQLIGSFAVPPTQQALDRLAQVAGQPWSAKGGFSYYHETGAPSPEPWLWLILGAAGVLVLGASGVALGLARVERRPDDATLTAVGASPVLRRGIAFWQAIVIVGIGSVTGTVAGVIPMWGIVMQSQGDPHWAPSMADTPWPWLALLALGLPLAIAAASWLVPPRRPGLTRRTVIA
ncbi:FtsX-like permease family protein [Microbacterium sp.]|uniref:FtsX-like permease family protein n=1 Tax=Microbacterium sp. TaxID=51671 RepID=UPI0039E427E4